MARVTPTVRTARRRLGLLFVCCALLLAAAACGDDDSVFTNDGNASPTSLPGGPGGEDDGPAAPGTGNDPGASAAVMPGSADIYVGIDLAAAADFQTLADTLSSLDTGALTEDLGNAVGGVSGELPDPAQAVEGVTEARDTIDCLGESLGLDTGGLPAWMGGEAAIGLFDMQFDAATGEMSEPRTLAVVAVDDQAGAAAALPGFLAAVGACGGMTFTESAYQGITIYSGTPEDGGAPASLALTEGNLLFGEGAGMLEQAIDLGDGASLADEAGFNEVLAALPEGRHVTGYLAPALLQRASSAVMAAAGETGGLSLPAGLNPAQALAGMRGMGLSATMLDEGIRLEMVALGETGGVLPVESITPGPMADMLPADAIGYFGIGGFDVPAAWGSLLEMLSSMPVEEGQPGVTETIAQMGIMLGIDIEADLIGQLTGEIGVALLPATAGSLVSGSQVNLGILAIMGVRDAGAMAATAEALANGLAAMSGAPASPRPFDGGTLYALSDGTADVALFGMAGDHMVITTHESHAAALLAGGDRLAGSSRYAEAIGGLPSGSAPMMYLDIAALMAALPVEDGQAAAANPLQTVAVSAAMEDQVARTIVYLRLDY